MKISFDPDSFRIDKRSVPNPGEEYSRTTGYKDYRLFEKISVTLILNKSIVHFHLSPFFFGFYFYLVALL